MINFKRIICVLIFIVSSYSAFLFSLAPFLERNPNADYYDGGKTYNYMAVLFLWAQEILTSSENKFEAEKRIRDLTTAPPWRANHLLFNYLESYLSHDQMFERDWQELKKYSDGKLFVDEWGRPLLFSFVWVTDEKRVSTELKVKVHFLGRNGIDEKGEGDDKILIVDHFLTSPAYRYDQRINSPLEVFGRRHRRALWITGLVISYGLCISSFILTIKLTRRIKKAKKLSDKKG